MTKFSITMSDELGAHVKDAMRDRKFDTTSEYFRHLVRQDFAREKAEQELRALIDEGLQSGISEKTAENIWAEAIANNKS